MRKNEEEQYTKILRNMSGVLLGGVLSLVVCLIMLLLCSLGISNGLLNDRYMIQYVIIVCLLGSFIGSCFAVRRCRTKTLIIGLGSGVVFFLLILTAGFLFFTDVSMENRGTALLCVSLAGGALAGLLGGKTKKKRRK